MDHNYLAKILADIGEINIRNIPRSVTNEISDATSLEFDLHLLSNIGFKWHVISPKNNWGEILLESERTFGKFVCLYYNDIDSDILFFDDEENAMIAALLLAGKNGK